MHLKSTLFLVILTTITFCWNTYTLPALQVPEAYYILLYFYLSTALVHNILIKVNKKSPKDFIKFYMATTGLRLMLNLMVITVFALLSKERAIPFTIAFMISYLAYLIFEVIILLNQTKK
jgi:hypothetical protein